MKKGRIEEIVSIRAVACMCVVMVHSLLTFITLQEITDDSSTYWVLDTIRALIVFGTPTFVFISALVVSYSYPEKLPDGFFKERVKFILLPYLFIAFFYAVVNRYDEYMQIPKEALYNAFGGYHGWFVLVIFQFYGLQKLFLKKMRNISPVIVLGVSLIINITYLGFFNLTVPFSDTTFVNYVWDKGYWLLFPGWLFYFSLAFYAGRNYTEFKRLLVQYKKTIIFSLVFFAGVLVINNTIGVFESGSKRMDMVFYASSMILFLFLIFSKVKTHPKFIKIISDYSFGIYLLHMFWLSIISKALQIMGMNISFLSIVVLFVGSIIASIFSIYCINLFPFGKYLIGKSPVKRKLEVNNVQVTKTQ